ncbi:MAG: outer membrane lipoprotein carrier protein LolA [Deltaproteobacteria bacterium]|nr:MAG: outer membrane lipoprotein carrier protein LolA [Deltaproteobacteria bacterium]
MNNHPRLPCIMSLHAVAFFFVVMGLLSPSTGAANSPSSKEPSVFSQPVASTKSQQQLRTIATQLQKVKVLRASFEQRKTIKVLSRPLVSHGTFLFARSVGVYWKTQTPFPAALLLTPKGLTEKDPNTGKNLPSSGSKTLMKAMSQMFVAILSVDIEKLSTMFVLHLQGTPQSWILGLKPKANGMKRFLRHIVLQGGNTVQLVQIAEANGDQTEYKISKVQTSPPKLTPAERKLFR